jgi:mannose-6-phosphate isomerase-like protein (cupin superfamily)
MLLEEASLARALPFKTARFTLPPGAKSELDEHEVVELWIVQDGAGRLRSGDTETILSPGQAVFFSSHVPHQVEATSDGPLQVLCIWWPETHR